MGREIVSEETPASKREHVSQPGRAACQATGLAELEAEGHLAQTQGSMLSLEDLLTQDLGSCTEAKMLPGT